MFWIFLLVLVGVILMIFLLLSRSNYNSTINIDSKKIIQRFEPDNAAPPLSEMIDFHKKNPTIKYKM